MIGEDPRATTHRGIQLEEAEDRRSIVAPGLRLTFATLGARWTHALTVGGEAGRDLLEVACAVESDPDRGDPARVVSPSYQAVQPQACAGGVRMLLTGMSVPHHFSAVVTARREGDGPGAGVVIDVDVADRCRAPIAVLAATYLVRLGSGALLDAGPDRVVWGGGPLDQGRLEFTTEGGPDTVALAEAGRQAARVQALARLQPTTFTQRLRYQWRWTPPGKDS
ncbi:MAG: hypothetical protein JO116_03765 [Planctomycetaceae bacterium]|nr:hypothetical protein [Planctomycetaceae bacterium]MBV8606785.1 hypothetical protein [Singulisphaera sp.]